MRNFDEERQRVQQQRDREFTIGGEVFHIREFVAPEELDIFMDREKPLVESYDEWLSKMLEPQDVPKWKKIREKADPPLSLHDIEQVVYYLIEVAAGRPTERSSSSTPGRRPQEGTSKAPSRSQVHAA